MVGLSGVMLQTSQGKMLLPRDVEVMSQEASSRSTRFGQFLQISLQLWANVFETSVLIVWIFTFYRCP